MKKPSSHRASPWECAVPKPPLSGEVARRNAETERSYQICSNLSVSLRLPAPLQGEPLVCANTEDQCKKVQTSKSGLHLLLMATILRQLAANLIPPYQAARTKTPVR